MKKRLCIIPLLAVITVCSNWAFALENNQVGSIMVIGKDGVVFVRLQGKDKPIKGMTYSVCDDEGKFIARLEVTGVTEELGTENNVAMARLGYVKNEPKIGDKALLLSKDEVRNNSILFEEALKDKDYKTMYSLLSTDTQKKITEEEYIKNWESFGKHYDVLSYEVGWARVKGEKAEIEESCVMRTVLEDKTVKSVGNYIKEEGEWKRVPDDQFFKVFKECKEELDYFKLFLAFLCEGKLEQAGRALGKVEEIPPGESNAKAFNEFLGLLVKQGKYKEMRKRFEKIKGVPPLVLKPYDYLSEAEELLRQGKYKESLEAITKAEEALKEGEMAIIAGKAIKEYEQHKASLEDTEPKTEKKSELKTPEEIITNYVLVTDASVQDKGTLINSAIIVNRAINKEGLHSVLFKSVNAIKRAYPQKSIWIVAYYSDETKVGEANYSPLTDKTKIRIYAFP
jgi:tetratricopeptide (TPR) repeat protein